MKVKTLILLLFAIFMTHTELYAIETAPRISDKEIVERLTRLEEGMKALEKRIEDTNKRIDALRDEMNKRFDMLMWMIGIFVSASFVTLGFVIRMQWQMNRRLSIVEASI